MAGLATEAATCDHDQVGRHRQPARSATRSTDEKTRPQIARPLAVVAALVAGFVAAQLFLPTTAGMGAAEDLRDATTAATVPRPIAAGVVPNTICTTPAVRTVVRKATKSAAVAPRVDLPGAAHVTVELVTVAPPFVAGACHLTTARAEPVLTQGPTYAVGGGAHDVYVVGGDGAILRATP